MAKAPKTAQHTGTDGSRSRGDQDWASILNVSDGDVVQELGWDEDCDSSISEALEDRLGEELLDVDTDEMVDVVLLWWRADDGDLVDGLVDATRNLGEDGRIWLLTPATGFAGTVQPGDISEAAKLAGMVQTSSERLADWQGACLVPPGKKR